MLTGKTAIVTGSTSGIGLATAEALAAKGCATSSSTPIPTATADHADRSRRRLERHGAEAVYIKADMSKPDDCRDAGREDRSRASARVDILVNNAGIQYVSPVETFPIEKWDAIIAINLSSAFHTAAAAIPHMKATGWGRIVNIASAHGLRASPNKSAYVAAKHGVVGLTKTIALELAGQGVTCNAVCPGFVLTPLVETQIEDRMKEEGLDREATIRDVILAKQPSKQFATVEEIGASVAFLCSNDAAQITGTTLSVDGGWTAQ
jgi:3-hydroxybutyrate dehydrogenase